MAIQAVRKVSEVVTGVLFLVLMWSWLGNDPLLYTIDRKLGSDDGDALFMLMLVVFAVSAVITLVLHLMNRKRVA